MKTFLAFFLFFIFAVHTEAFSILEKYNNGEKIKILIVPGHDNDSIGAKFMDLREVDLNRLVAEKLVNIFAQYSQFEIINAHQGGFYNTDLQSYFDTKMDEIISWKKKHIKQYKKKQAKGLVEHVDNPVHGVAKEYVANRLYGINKWAGENNVDLLLHLHFNDYGSRKWNKEGEVSGFSVYVPESQLPNGKESIEVGGSVFSELKKVQFQSSQKQEGSYQGVIPDQQLIALGASETLKVPSILIEYGYIYEPILRTEARDLFINSVADATVSGVLKYFDKNFSNNSLVYNLDFAKQKDKGIKVFGLQHSLKKGGFYPSSVDKHDDCPFSVYFGECTKRAVMEFQQKHSIEQTGFFGPKTRSKLLEILKS